MPVEQKNLIYSGRGKIFVATYGTKLLRWIGDCTALAISLTVTKLKDKEMYSGLDRVQRVITTGGEGTWQATCKSFSPKNLAAVLHGTHKAVNSGSVTAEALPSGLAVGDIVQLANQKLSDVVVKDSATPTPATLTVTTDYVVDATYGTIEIKNLGSYTQPFKVDYSYAAREAVGLFTIPAPAVYMRFHGLNKATADGQLEPVLVEIYNSIIDPTNDLNLMQTEIANFTLGGEMLVDETKDVDADLGQMGAVTYLN